MPKSNGHKAHSFRGACRVEHAGVHGGSMLREAWTPENRNEGSNMATIISIIMAPLILFMLPGEMSANGQESGITRHDFWEVDLARTESATVHVGDLVMVKAPTYPVIPANLKKTFSVEYERERLRFVAEEPPEVEGRMGKRYYFVALRHGETEVRCVVKQAEREVEAFKLSILVKP